MLRGWIVVVSGLAACSFTVNRREPPVEDALVADDAAAPDRPLDRVVPCATPDPTGLVLCLEIEDGVADGTLADSSPAHRDAITSGLAPATRAVPSSSGAALVGTAATTRVAQTAALDLAAGYTMAIWVRPDALPPPNKSYGLFDHELQYAMLIGRSPGEAVRDRCVHTGVARYEYTENLPAGAWSFLACTWDGAQLCAYRWTSAIDHDHRCHVPATGPAAAGAQGLAIGHLSERGAAHGRLAGAFDSAQLYDRGLTADQLCALVGQPAGCMPCDACRPGDARSSDAPSSRTP